MPLLQLINIRKSYASTELFESINTAINPGEKIGLIGPNGSGKTTLLKIISGLEDPEKGEVITQAGTRISYVPQYHNYSKSDTVSDILLKDFLPIEGELRRREIALSGVSGEALEKVLADYQKARDTYDAWQGDTIRNKSKTVLSQLELNVKQNRPVCTLSGGEKNTVALGRAIISNPDLLLLDEPGNHLDFIGLAFLEEFIRSFKGAVLMVSHNRYLLDRTVTAIFELQSGQATRYQGNYSAYRVLKLTNVLAQARQHSAEQKKIMRLENLVKKFEDIASRIADPAWGKRLRARRTQLERAKADAVDAPFLENKKIGFSFNGSSSSADIALRVKRYRKSFPGRELFKDVNLQIDVGQRAALLGINGSGKSTLLNDIVSLRNWNHSVIQIGPSMKIGYCAQNQEVFDKAETLLNSFLHLKRCTRHEVHGFLSKFLFSWEDLDEPTNHLDIKAKEAIEEGLEDFKGTMFVVSHDRYFLERLTDTVLYIDNGIIRKHSGDISSFLKKWSNHFLRTQKGGGFRRKDQIRNLQQHNSKAATENISDKKIEERIQSLERKKGVLEKRIIMYFEENKIKEARKLEENLKSTEGIINKLYEEWLSMEK